MSLPGPRAAQGSARAPAAELIARLPPPLFYGDVGLRPMRDVDLLVRPRDLPRAMALFESLGFVALP